MRLWLAKLAGSALLLGALIWWVDLEAVLNRLKAADAGWLILSLSALLLTTASMARRWQMTARICGIELSYGTALREYYVAQFLNSVLPGGVIGDVGRAVRLRDRAGLARAGQSVLAERLTGQFAMFGILAIGLLIAGRDLELTVRPGWGMLFLIGGGCAAALMAWIAMRAHASREFLRVQAKVIRNPAIVAHAVVGAGLLIVSLYAATRATGSILPPEAWLTVLPLIFCAMLVPLSVAGWGWREGAAAALFPLVGLSSNAGVAAGICYGAVMLISTLPALGFIAVPIRKPFKTGELEQS